MLLRSSIFIFETGTCNKLGLVSFPRLKYFQRNVDEPEDPNFFENGAKDSGDFVTYVESKIDEAERAHLGVIGDANGKYSKRRRSNIAVIIVRRIFIGSFLFYCLLLNHSFPTNPNSVDD